MSCCMVVFKILSIETGAVIFMSFFWYVSRSFSLKCIVRFRGAGCLSICLHMGRLRISFERVGKGIAKRKPIRGHNDRGVPNAARRGIIDR